MSSTAAAPAASRATDLPPVGGVQHGLPQLALHHDPSAPGGARGGRAWVSGVAVVLGAAGLVAAGYSAAYVRQLLSSGQYDHVPVLSASAPADVGSRAASSYVAPSRSTSVPSSRGAVFTHVPTAKSAAAIPATDSGPLEVEVDVEETIGRSGSSGTRKSRAHALRSAQAEPTANAGRMPPPVPEHTQSASAAPAKVPDLNAPEPERERIAAAEGAQLNESPSRGLQREGDNAAVDLGMPPVLTVTPLTAAAVDAARSSSDSELRQPSRKAVKDVMLAARTELGECVGDTHGISYANLTINGDGRVTYSLIDGAFAGTPAGSCIARRLRTVSFPSFSGPPFKVRYPLAF